MIRKNSESLLTNFIDSLSEQLTADNFLELFSNYLQEKFSESSFAGLQHAYSPWPYRILTPGVFGEQALPVLLNLNPENYVTERNRCYFKIRNLHIFPFKDYNQRVQYILLGSTTDSGINKTIIRLCGHAQNLFNHLSRTAQISAGRIRNQYGAYISNLTHDFNSLLAIISTLNIENDIVRQKLNYGKKLTCEFLFYLAEPELSKISIEVNELLAAILQNYSTPIEIRNTLPSGQEQIRLQVDPESINRAVHAVLDNAVYYAGLVKGKVQIEIARLKNISLFIHHDWLKLSIVNSGPVIPSEFLDRIKEPLFTTLKDQGKVGMGLAIADKIIQAHSGGMIISNLDSGGVQVTICLPLEEEYA